MIVQRGDNVRNMDLSKYEKVRKIDGDGKREEIFTWNEHCIAMIGNIKGYHGN